MRLNLHPVNDHANAASDIDVLFVKKRAGFVFECYPSAVE